MGKLGVRYLFLVTMVAVLAVAAACASSAPAPTAAPAAPKAAAPAAPTSAPAAAAAKPAAPTAAPAAKAAEPAKPAAQPKVEIRAATTVVKDAMLSRSVDKFAELVGQKTNGEVLVRVFHGTMGGDQQLMPAVLSGSLDIGMASNGNSARYTGAFYIWDLPFLFKTYENCLKSLDTPIGKEALAQYEKEFGAKLVYTISYGSGRDVQVRNKRLRVPDDVKGSKIRVVSTPIDLATVKAWGANPTPVEWAQVYPALQQGVVDGEAIPITLVASEKHYEIVKYGIRIDYQALFQLLFMNQKKFDSLSPAHQKAFMEAAAEAHTWTRKAAAEEVQDNLKKMREVGMDYHEPTPQEYAQWASIREKVWEEVAAGELKGKIDLDKAKKLYDSQ